MHLQALINVSTMSSNLYVKDVHLELSGAGFEIWYTQHKQQNQHETHCRQPRIDERFGTLAGTHSKGGLKL